MQVTLGTRRNNTIGQPALFETPEDLANLLTSRPPVDEHWWSAHIFRENKRGGTNWLSSSVVALDLDYYNANGEHASPEDEDRRRLEGANITGSLFHHSPRGARVAFVLDRELAQRDAYLLAVHGAISIVESELRGAGLLRGNLSGFEVDSCALDLARFLFCPRSLVPSDKQPTPRDDKVDVVGGVFCADDLFAVARPPQVEEQPTRSFFEDKDKPGSEFNARSSWAEILEPHGWTKCKGKLKGNELWARPDKNPKHGHSATANDDVFYCFTSASSLDERKGYSRFGLYAALNHNGDCREAAKDLALKGYGSDLEIPDDMDLTGITGPQKIESDRRGIHELLSVPGMIGEMSTWINDASIKPQPMLALGATIAFAGVVLGQRVKTRTGLRTNMYTLGIGETGCGKERARQVIKSLMYELERDDLIGGSFASGSAVETAVERTPITLYLIDEIGHMLASMKRGTAPGYVEDIPKVFLEMYESSQSTYRCRSFADTKRNEETKNGGVIYQPCLCVYGTTVPVNFYNSITKEQLANGLLSRFLVFESDDPDPHVRYIDDRSLTPPASILSWCREWFANQGDGGNIRPEPVAIAATTAAMSVFSRMEADFRALRKAEREAGGDQGVYTRCWAMAQKVALIRACGCMEQEITETCAQWACDLVWYLVNRFVERAKGHISENRTEDDTLRLIRLIQSRGSDGVSKSELCLKTKWLKKRDRDDLIMALVESGEVRTGEKSTSGRKRQSSFPTAFWVEKKLGKKLNDSA